MTEIATTVFKAGDVVRCVNAVAEGNGPTNDTGLTLGKEYTVAEGAGLPPSLIMLADHLAPDGNTLVHLAGFYLSSRFEIVAAAAKRGWEGRSSRRSRSVTEQAWKIGRERALRGLGLTDDDGEPISKFPPVPFDMDDPNVAAKMLEKIKYLYAAHNVDPEDPDACHQLMAKIATEYIPGFKIRTAYDGSPKSAFASGNIAYLDLYHGFRTGETVVRKNPGDSVGAAFEALDPKKAFEVARQLDIKKEVGDTRTIDPKKAFALFIRLDIKKVVGDTKAHELAQLVINSSELKELFANRTHHKPTATNINRSDERTDRDRKWDSFRKHVYRKYPKGAAGNPSEYVYSFPPVIQNLMDHWRGVEMLAAASRIVTDRDLVAAERFRDEVGHSAQAPRMVEKQIRTDTVTSLGLYRVPRRLPNGRLQFQYICRRDGEGWPAEQNPNPTATRAEAIRAFESIKEYLTTDGKLVARDNEYSSIVLTEGRTVHLSPKTDGAILPGPQRGPSKRRVGDALVVKT